jgi:predicted nucleic acid-binding Zn ribbon protein
VVDLEWTPSISYVSISAWTEYTSATTSTFTSTSCQAVLWVNDKCAREVDMILILILCMHLVVWLLGLLS